MLHLHTLLFKSCSFGKNYLLYNRQFCEFIFLKKINSMRWFKGSPICSTSGKYSISHQQLYSLTSLNVECVTVVVMSWWMLQIISGIYTLRTVLTTSRTYVFVSVNCNLTTNASFRLFSLSNVTIDASLKNPFSFGQTGLIC